ncbi:MAG: hypothetical protein Q7U40_07095 [Desulfatirhabdiaceae bacterium]|nr:hypothetical protein [Desulfatirhabdiaceae bacterium]
MTITILNASARNGVGTGMRTVFGTLLGDFMYQTGLVLVGTVVARRLSRWQCARLAGVALIGFSGMFSVNVFRAPNSMLTVKIPLNIEAF